VRKVLIGAFRDVRGILESVTSKPAFSLMFDWLYPNYVSVMTEGVKIWFDDPQVAVPILKCMCEFVTNKNSRLVMHTSSPNGILLFRETSKMLRA
jgi:exportin-7